MGPAWAPLTTPAPEARGCRARSCTGSPSARFLLFGIQEALRSTSFTLPHRVTAPRELQSRKESDK